MLLTHVDPGRLRHHRQLACSSFLGQNLAAMIATDQTLGQCSQRALAGTAEVNLFTILLRVDLLHDLLQTDHDVISVTSRVESKLVRHLVIAVHQLESHQAQMILLVLKSFTSFQKHNLFDRNRAKVQCAGHCL